MTQQSTNTNIPGCPGQNAAGDLSDSSTQLLAALGYRRRPPARRTDGNVDHFMADFKADNTDTRSEQGFRDSTKEVRILFQFTDTEIAATGNGGCLTPRLSVPETPAASSSLPWNSTETLTLAAGTSPSLAKLNKRFNRMPAAIVFRTADGRVTLAFVNRRPARYEMIARCLAAFLLSGR